MLAFSSCRPFLTLPYPSPIYGVVRCCGVSPYFPDSSREKHKWVERKRPPTHIWEPYGALTPSGRGPYYVEKKNFFFFY